MSDASGHRCHECFELAVVDGICGKCRAVQAEVRRDRRALPLWTEIGGKYRVGKVLGAGGFGITYIAQDLNLGRRAAVKEYFPTGLVSRSDDGVGVSFNSSEDQAPFERGLDRFFREGQLLARLDHPNIVRVYDALQSNGTAYLVMEYLDGRTLKQWLDEGNRFDTAKALKLIGFVLDALKAVHRANIIHRDIKPDNIYITESGRVLLLDFGGAKQLTAEGERSMDAMFAHGYAAPEQYFADSGKVGPWTDVYGAAATLYRVLAGARLRSALERSGDDSPLDWRDSDAPAAVRRAVAKALSLRQADRFQTVEQLEDALAQPLQPSAPPHPPPLPPDGPPQPDRRWSTGAIVGFAGVALAALGLIGWQFLPSAPTSPKPDLPPVAKAPSAHAASASHPPASRSVAAAPPPASSPSVPRAAAAQAGGAVDPRTRDMLNDMLESAGSGNWAGVKALALKIRSASGGGAAPPKGARSAQMTAADDAIEAGSYAKAVGLLRDVVRDQPDDEQAWAALGYASMRMGSLAEAKLAVTKGLAIAADDGGAWATMAELLALGDFDDPAGQALGLAVYFSKQRTAMLDYLKTSPHLAPKLRAIIRQQIGRLERVPERSS